MIEYHTGGVRFPLNEAVLEQVAMKLREENTQATHLVMHPTVRDEYAHLVTPDIPTWAKSVDGDGKTIYAIEVRALLAWRHDGRDYPVVTDPDAPRNVVAFWRGSEKVAEIRDVSTY